MKFIYLTIVFGLIFATHAVKNDFNKFYVVKGTSSNLIIVDTGTQNLATMSLKTKTSGVSSACMNSFRGLDESLTSGRALDSICSGEGTNKVCINILPNSDAGLNPYIDITGCYKLADIGSCTLDDLDIILKDDLNAMMYSSKDSVTTDSAIKTSSAPCQTTAIAKTSAADNAKTMYSVTDMEAYSGNVDADCPKTLTTDANGDVVVAPWALDNDQCVSATPVDCQWKSFDGLPCVCQDDNQLENSKCQCGVRSLRTRTVKVAASYGGAECDPAGETQECDAHYTTCAPTPSPSARPTASPTQAPTYDKDECNRDQLLLACKRRPDGKYVKHACKTGDDACGDAMVKIEEGSTVKNCACDLLNGVDVDKDGLPKRLASTVRALQRPACDVV